MLLGREPELIAIDQALAAARLGTSSRLLIRGEPGIGKTALLEHAVSEAGSMRVLAARGVEFEADVPFAGLHELLHPTLALLDRLPKRLAAAWRSSLGLGPRIEADRLIIGAAALRLISAYAEDRPLLITVDDAQWLDRASAEAIGFAARRLFADPVSILIAIRDEEESPLLAAGLPELRLSGLDHASATALLEQAAPGQVSSERADWMLNATGGNPLALLELGRESPHVSTSPHDTLPIATSVERAYLRRADGLSESARRVLLVVAASGTPELRLVQAAAAALGLSPSDVEEAEAARGLVNQRSQRIEFVHPLARAAIYHSASPADRRAAHKALANVMSGADDVDRRAWHLAAAASGWDAAAATALEGAAQRARESTGYAAAASAWTESARLTEPTELRAARMARSQSSPVASRMGPSTCTRASGCFSWCRSQAPIRWCCSAPGWWACSYARRKRVAISWTAPLTRRASTRPPRHFRLCCSCSDGMPPPRTVGSLRALITTKARGWPARRRNSRSSPVRQPDWRGWTRSRAGRMSAGLTPPTRWSWRSDTEWVFTRPGR